MKEKRPLPPRNTRKRGHAMVREWEITQEHSGRSFTITQAKKKWPHRARKKHQNQGVFSTYKHAHQPNTRERYMFRYMLFYIHPPVGLQSMSMACKNERMKEG